MKKDVGLRVLLAAALLAAAVFAGMVAVAEDEPLPNPTPSVKTSSQK